jgi:hypothetical protein
VNEERAAASLWGSRASHVGRTSALMTRWEMPGGSLPSEVAVPVVGSERWSPYGNALPPREGPTWSGRDVSAARLAPRARSPIQQRGEIESPRGRCTAHTWAATTSHGQIAETQAFVTPVIPQVPGRGGSVTELRRAVRRWGCRVSEMGRGQ